MEGRVKAPELAELLNTTPAFITQVVGQLVKAGWVRSVPGPTGGYELTAAADGLSALDVIEAVDGPTATGDCVLENRPCQAADSCVLHEAWRAARAVLTRALADVPATRCPPNLLPATTSPTPGPTQEP